MDIRLDGRTALITGGSKGLGLAMATRFAQSGAEVAILARGAEALAEAERGIRAKAQIRVKGFPCDVGKAEEIWGKFFGRLIFTVCSRSRCPRTRQELGWAPRHFDLDEMLQLEALCP